jgi:hypothetical protein
VRDPLSGPVGIVSGAAPAAAIAARFRGIASAPRDGSLIEVRHGPDQVAVLARWAGQTQAWIADGDPVRRTLHRVSVWRPAPDGAGVADLVRPVLQMIEPAVPAVPPLRPAIVHARKPRR